MTNKAPASREGHAEMATMGKPALTPEQMSEAVRLYQSGETIRLVAGRFGVSTCAVRTALRRLAVSARGATESMRLKVDASPDEPRDITLEQLKRLLHYDPETGLFHWAADRLSIKPGAPAGSLHAEGYIVITIGTRKLYAHRLAWFYMTGQWPSMLIDHINRTRNDNRWVNLRDVDASTNLRNREIRPRASTAANACK